MIKLFYILCIGAGLTACSSVNTISVTNHSENVLSDDISSRNEVTSFVQPYRDSLAAEMDKVIGHSSINFMVNRPNSNLGNWFSDAVFVNQTRTVRLSKPIFCLFNTGGIRSSFNIGAVTLGDVYKIMPFDNEIVWVELPIEVLPEIEEYIQKKGGEPISNATMLKGKLMVNGIDENTTSFIVITSDYLMNGGDKMDFFKKHISVNLTGKLLRDALIDEVINQNELVVDTTERIQL